MEVCDEGEDDEVGLYGIVWYGMVLFSFSFFFFFFSFPFFLSFLFFVHQVNGARWGCGNERERERVRKRERSASKQRAAMYTFIISHLFSPQHIHSLNHR